MEYSADFRQRAVEAVLAGEMTQAQVAKIFGIGTATLTRWLRKYRETGSFQGRERRGHPTPCLDQEDLVALAELVDQKPDRTLGELQDLLCEQRGTTASVTTLFRMLQQLALTRKKKL